MTGPRPLARMVSRIAAKALGRHGQAFGALLSEWASIMGPELGARTIPDRLTFPARGREGRSREGGTLSIRAHASVALELQHAEPQILERINQFFGYLAVARIRLIQAPLRHAPRPARPTRPLDARDEARIRATVEGIEDETLRNAMTALGRAMAARDRTRDRS